MNPMPRYRCHKEVWALKIERIDVTPGGGGYTLTPADERFAPFTLPGYFVDKHNPAPGGYFVRYDDGYESYSPAKAFEDGYTLVPQ